MPFVTRTKYHVIKGERTMIRRYHTSFHEKLTLFVPQGIHRVNAGCFDGLESNGDQSNA